MTECTRYSHELKAHIDGELSWHHAWVIRRHLTRCASCQKEIAAMTQMTEDLKATEPEGALPTRLREKLLESGIHVPGTGSAGLSSSESRSATEDSFVPGPKRRLPVWAFAALAVVAWFVCSPLFQKTRENSVSVGSVTSSSEPRNIEGFKPQPPSAAPAVPGPLARRTIPALPATAQARPMAAPIAVRAGSVPLGAVTSNGASDSSALNADPDSLRQVHKEASIGIQVPNPEATGETVNDMVKESGGYVAANNLFTGTDSLKSGEMIVKVPEAQFETFLAAVAKLGTVVSKNITGEDITEKTSDAHEAQSVQESDLAKAEARLKALGSSAKWEDQESTRDLRVQLAQTRARLKLLKRMAALGTITIDLSQTPKAAAVPPVTNGFVGTLKATTHDALQSLVGSASALLALVIWLLAYAPLWVPLALLGRYALKEYKKREAV